MGLFGNMFKGRMKDPVRAQAQVVSCTAYDGESSWQNCEIQLVVQAPGVPATPVRKHDMVRASRWPVPGMTLPVTVDRADPERVKIEWGEVEDSKDRSARTAEAMAAAMRGDAPAGGFGGLGAGDGVDVVNLSGQDMSRLSPEQKAKLQMLGVDPGLLAAQQGASAAAASPGPRDAGGAEDERLARLAKLGQLRDQGVLTPEEFEVQKRRILHS
jgi:hypothetical protein